jgi:DNA end-binding protein Ku
MAKTAKSTEATEAAAKLAEICENPTIDLTPVRKESKTATFTGTLAFNLMSFPVKTYKATDEDGVSFNQVHKCGDTHVQLKQGAMHCPLCNVDVPKNEILKGFNLGNEKAPKFLAVTQEDINAQKPASDKVMTLTTIVKATEIDPIFYESNEFIAADKGGEKPFSMLVAGLKRNGTVAKGIRVKGGRNQEFVLRPYGENSAAVSYLRTTTEVRKFDKVAIVAPSTDPKVAAMEAKMASMIDTLLSQNMGAFVPAEEDTFLANTRRMLEAKSAGVEVTVPTVAPVPSTDEDLMAQLEKSLAAVAGK